MRYQDKKLQQLKCERLHTVSQGFHDHKWTQAKRAIMALFPPRNACRIFMCQNTKADMTTFLPDQTNDEKQIRAISI